MDNAGYAAITRLNGLQRELQLLANNMANISTTGFRREGVLFSEFVRNLDGGEAPLSMASANARQTYFTQGAMTQTGAALDLAIEGNGFFLVETQQGERLTRAGHFQTNPDGEMVTPDGHALLDLGGARVFVPVEAGVVAIARDGTLSVDGAPLGQIAMVRPEDPTQLRRITGVLLEPLGEILPAEEAVIHQGFLEESNVNPLTEMARLIAVQRAYELGQSFLDREDERIRAVVQTLGR